MAIATVHAVKQSMDPYGDIAPGICATRPQRNPDAFFQRKLDEALKDEKFKGELLAKLQPLRREAPSLSSTCLRTCDAWPLRRLRSMTGAICQMKVYSHTRLADSRPKLLE
jgi:hypothetical protein